MNEIAVPSGNTQPLLQFSPEGRRRGVWIPGEQGYALLAALQTLFVGQPLYPAFA